MRAKLFQGHISNGAITIFNCRFQQKKMYKDLNETLSGKYENKITFLYSSNILTP